MKRLLCIVSAMDAGGAETFLMKVYRKLDKTKYQMDFCVNKFDKGFYDDEITQLGGHIYYIPSKSSNVWEFKKKLGEIVKNNHYESVMRITSNAMGFMDLMIAKKAGAKNCIARSSNSSDGGGFISKVAHCLGKILYEKYVDIKIAPSDLAAEYTFGKKTVQRAEVVFIHNGVDLAMFRFDQDGRRKVRKEFDIDEDAIVIGHIGRFSAQKNHGFLVRVFAEYKERNKNAVLLLVGEGELEKTVREEVCQFNLSGSVIFAGIRNDIPQLLSAMDIFAFPSLFEGMPNTVIEAQATGLHCVISDTITQEADIGGTVNYVSITSGTAEWVDCLEKSKSFEINRTTAMISSEYDIDNVVRQFTKLVFM